MKKSKSVLFGIIMLLATLIVCTQMFFAAAEQDGKRDYYRIVVLADPHYPFKPTVSNNPAKRQKRVTAKLKAIEDINAWNDVDLVVIVGDIVAVSGTTAEYAQAKEFVSKINKPLAIIAGNHEYMYSDHQNAKGRYPWGTAELRQEKLTRFRETFGLTNHYYSRMLGKYHLLFLSPDAVNGRYLTEISDHQIKWLDSQLQENSKSPVLIFFHAPLENTLLQYNQKVNKPNFVAQPATKLRAIITENPQIKAWVSGHTHTPPTNPSFKHSVNIFQGGVLNIHNSDMERQTIWTNSLYLYEDRIVIKTFNHKIGEWLSEMEREIR